MPKNFSFQVLSNFSNEMAGSLYLELCDATDPNCLDIKDNETNI